MVKKIMIRKLKDGRFRVSGGGEPIVTTSDGAFAKRLAKARRESLKFPSFRKRRKSIGRKSIRKTIKFKGKQLFAVFESLPFNKGIKGRVASRRISGNFTKAKVRAALKRIQNS